MQTKPSPRSDIKRGKATGPRTPEGRERASQNARKHGLTSAQRNTELVAEMRALIDAHFSAFRVSSFDLARLAEAEALLQRISAVEAQVSTALDMRLAGGSIGLEGAAPEVLCVQEIDGLLENLRRLWRYRAEADAQRRKALHAVLAHAKDAQVDAKGHGHGL